jgi:DNA gyrase inhibitor GyrI
LIAGNSANNVQSKIDEIINTFIKWFERNRLVINKEKTIAISLHQPQKVHFECPSIKIYDTVIKYSEQLKFLGVCLDKNLSWAIHTQELAKKAM